MEQLWVQGAVFFVLFGGFWYYAQIKNFWGLGVNVGNKKQAAVIALITAAVATLVFTALLYGMNRFQ